MTSSPSDTIVRLGGRLLIDGQLREAREGRTFALHNPATGKLLCEVAAADSTDVELAVRSAAQAQRGWANIPARERGKRLIAASQALASHAEELARLIALESGKALRTECRPEAANVADVLQFFGGLASELKGETVPLKPGLLSYTQVEPVGVVAVVLPWNVPLMLMAVKIAPALVAGNAVVVKSAEETPLSIVRAAELLGEHLPKGVLNVVSGEGPVCGAALVRHPQVAKITFTGSVETGRLIYRAAADKIVPVTLELGGKSPMIVMADADLDRAVDGAVVAMRFTRQGQSCTAASRMLVHRNLHDDFVRKLKAKIDRLVIGDPLDERTDIGAIISKAQLEKILAYIELGRSDPAATAHECGQLPNDERLRGGNFVRPVIFTGLDNRSRLAQEEIFGPVTCVMPFATLAEAIETANDSSFGLAASVWTRDLASALQAANALEAGYIQINQAQVAGPNISYGGYKQSGLGKELTLESMLEHFTRRKSVVINLE